MNKLYLILLLKNLGYQNGESVAIIAQKYDESLPLEVKEEMDASYAVAKEMFETFNEAAVKTSFHEYVPSTPRNGVDAPKELYELEADIFLMPTAYSLSHTNFRKHLSEKGARIATLPGITPDMCQQGGPLDCDPTQMADETEKLAARMRRARSLRLFGEKTDILVVLDPNLIYAGTGIHTKKGAWGNLPGAEAYGVPIDANGYFTVPAGWGGKFPLEYDVTFYIENAKFVRFECENKEYLDKIRPFFEEDNFEVLAELGVGTNPRITNSYMRTHPWSTLLGEKVSGSAHFANGNSKGMGGSNDVPIHIDWVVPNIHVNFE